MKFQKRIIIWGYVITLSALLLFCGLQKAEYERIYDIDIANISDKTSEFEFGVDAPVDSDYIVVSGYAYQVKEPYKSIDYKIVLKQIRIYNLQRLVYTEEFQKLQGHFRRIIMRYVFCFG